MSVSVVINTLNEEENIRQAINSVKGFADEVIVVDMESSDKTTEIAKKLGALVFSHAPMNYVEPARNFAISKAKGEWILILDADEEATLKLLKELKRIVKLDLADFVRIPRKNLIFKKWVKHARWWPDYNVRFFRKGYVTWEEEIHSVPITSGREFNLQDIEEFSLIHHHYVSIEQYIVRMNRYTSIQATELLKKGKTAVYSDFLRKPSEEFLSRYFAGEGYKDGLHGLVVSSLQSLSQVVVYAKLWQLQGFKDTKVSLSDINQEINTTQKDTNYWKAHAMLQTKNSIKLRIKRRLKLQ